MNARNTLALSLTATAALALLSGCSGPTHREVTRVDPNAVVDLDYRFNDTDARQVWQAMSNDSTFRGWIDRWMAAHNGARPIVIVGPIRNNTQDYIDSNLFTADFEKELLNSGRVQIVQSRDDRGNLRDERLQGQEWNSAATKKIMKSELGADLMLMGVVTDVQQRSLNGRTVSKYYHTKFTMTNIETNEVVWIGTQEIKKVSNDR